MKMRDLSKRRDRYRPLAFAGALVLALASPVVLAQKADGAGSAEASNHVPATNESKEQLIRTLVNLTDVSQLQAVFSQEFVDRVSNAVAMLGPTIDPQTMNIIQQETRAVVQEHIADGDALYSVLAPVYQKHFNLIELNQLVNFYQSPLGQKLVRVSPQLLTESLNLGQQWGLSLVPEIMQRVQTRLNGGNPDSTGQSAGP